MRNIQGDTKVRDKVFKDIESTVVGGVGAENR